MPILCSRQYYIKLFRDWLDKIQIIDLMSIEEIKQYLAFFNRVVCPKVYALNLDFRKKNYINTLIRDILFYD